MMNNLIATVVPAKTPLTSGAGGWYIKFNVLDQEEALKLKEALTSVSGDSNRKHYALALVELDIDTGIIAEQVKPKAIGKPYGVAAKLLRYDLDGYEPTIRNIAFLRLFGTDSDYQAFCRAQPCAKSGDTQNIVYAHVRRASNSGVGIKPEYWGIPLTKEWHDRQHQVGEVTAFGSKDFMEWQRDAHISMWIGSIFGVQSLGYVAPADMVKFCAKKNAVSLLPAKYRELA